MGGQSSFHVQDQIWDLKFFSKGWGLVILPCPGQIWNLKFLVMGGGSVILSMSRPKLGVLKFKIFGGGRSSFHVQVPIWNLKIFGGLGPGHLTMSRQIWNLKFLVVGGSVIFPCPGQIWNLKFLARMRVGHLSMSRPNLKFKIFSEGGGQSSFHVQAKSEI